MYKSMIFKAVAAGSGAVTVASAIALTTLVDRPPSPPEAAVLGISLAKNDGPNGHGDGLEKKQVLASGEVTGLYPGVVTDLVVSLRNQNNFPVAVTDIVVAVASTAPACPHEIVRIDEFHGSRVIPRNATATQTMSARMHNEAPDECKNVTFQLTFTGTAVKP